MKKIILIFAFLIPILFSCTESTNVNEKEVLKPMQLISQGLNYDYILSQYDTNKIYGLVYFDKTVNNYSTDTTNYCYVVENEIVSATAYFLDSSRVGLSYEPNIKINNTLLEELVTGTYEYLSVKHDDGTGVDLNFGTSTNHIQKPASSNIPFIDTNIAISSNIQFSNITRNQVVYANQGLTVNWNHTSNNAYYQVIMYKYENDVLKISESKVSLNSNNCSFSSNDIGSDLRGNVRLEIVKYEPKLVSIAPNMDILVLATSKYSTSLNIR